MGTKKASYRFLPGRQYLATGPVVRDDTFPSVGDPIRLLKIKFATEGLRATDGKTHERSGIPDAVVYILPDRSETDRRFLRDCGIGILGGEYAPPTDRRCCVWLTFAEPDSNGYQPIRSWEAIPPGECPAPPAAGLVGHKTGLAFGANGSITHNGKPVKLKGVMSEILHALYRAFPGPASIDTLRSSVPTWATSEPTDERITQAISNLRRSGLLPAGLGVSGKRGSAGWQLEPRPAHNGNRIKIARKSNRG
jgi:hypothetical protein